MRIQGIGSVWMRVGETTAGGTTKGHVTRCVMDFMNMLWINEEMHKIGDGVEVPSLLVQPQQSEENENDIRRDE